MFLANFFTLSRFPGCYKCNNFGSGLTHRKRICLYNFFDKKGESFSLFLPSLSNLLKDNHRDSMYTLASFSGIKLSTLLKCNVVCYFRLDEFLTGFLSDRGG